MHIFEMGDTVQELSIKVIKHLGTSKPQFKVLAVQASPCLLCCEVFHYGKGLP